MANLILDARLEWDNPEFQKRDWEPGPWLDEPDKVQFPIPDLGYKGLLVRSYHGAWCGYVGIPPGHPAHGYSYNGYSQLIDDIIRAQHMENIRDWGRKGYPKNEHGFPDIETGPEEPPISGLGQRILDVRVHGGLTWSGSPSIVSEGAWHNIQRQFDYAEKQALQYPIGDAARWLHKWTPAKHDFEVFKEICKKTSICFEPTDDDIWLFGFDCAHAGDKMPALDALMERLKREIESLHPKTGETYRNTAYVENECLNLATQLKTMEK